MVSLVTLVNILLAGVVVFFERRDIGTTWAWLMILLFVPLLGFLVYIFLGRQLKQKNFYNLTVDELSHLSAAVDDQWGMLRAMDSSPSRHTDLMKMNLRSSNALITSDNEIQIFDDGKVKFESLFRDMESAKKEINVQYYIIQCDSLGGRLRDVLTKKAKEGVKVRILYDDIGSRGMRKKFFKELLSYGGEVEAFFPSLLRIVNFRMNNRNHRKLCIIDGEIAYIGGFNVGDEYLGLDASMGYWRDTHFRIIGGAVDLIQARFLMDWNRAGDRRENDLSNYAFRTSKHHGNSVVQIISSGPNSQTEHLKNMYIKMIMSAREFVFIQTPYFIPDTSFLDACKIALLSGVDVRIMIPNKPDHPFVYSATWSYVGELLPYGAKVLLYERGFMHAKTIVVDQEVASVGTTNIDTRSFRLNFESNAIVYDEQIAKQLHALFLKDSEVCSALTLERYRSRSIVVKFKESVSRLLSPIL